jgi:hypothetical protein
MLALQWFPSGNFSFSLESSKPLIGWKDIFICSNGGEDISESIEYLLPNCSLYAFSGVA